MENDLNKLLVSLEQTCAGVVGILSKKVEELNKNPNSEDAKAAHEMLKKTDVFGLVKKHKADMVNLRKGFKF